MFLDEKSCAKFSGEKENEEWGGTEYSSSGSEGIAKKKGLLADEGDWRTIGLILTVYLVWAIVVFYLPQWLYEGPWLIVIILGLAPLLTLHSSLQHECLHGHPFQSQKLNDLIVTAPLGVFIPYSRFKATHLQHHQDNNLCDPFEDPESWYLDAGDWLKQNRLWRLVLTFNNLLVGRVLMGPLIGALGTVRGDLRRGMENGVWLPGNWLSHLALIGVFGLIIGFFSHMPIWAYLLACYLGMSLLMVRTFAEHQSELEGAQDGSSKATVRRGRSIIVENGGLFSFLFLNNSLHAVHHAAPSLAWYRLPARYRMDREKYLAMNRGYRVESYFTQFLLYAFRRKEPVPYPGKYYKGDIVEASKDVVS